MRKENIDLSSIRIFVTTTEQGSFAASAKKLGLTRSAVGKAIIRLESYLGVRLLHRTTRKMSLTTDGQTFYKSCVEILESIEIAENTIRKDKLIPKGVLKLTLSQAFGRIIVLPLLKEFIENWPQLGLEISFSDRIIDIVEEGFDLGIRVGNIEQNSQLIYRVITKCNLYLCASPSYLLKMGTPETIDDLKEHQMLIYGLESANYNLKLYSNDGVIHSVQGVGQFKFDSGEAIKDTAIEGLGIAYLPEFMVEKDIKSGHLIQILPMYTSDLLPINVIYPNKKNLPIRVRLFIDALIEHFNHPL